MSPTSVARILKSRSRRRPMDRSTASPPVATNVISLPIESRCRRARANAGIVARVDRPSVDLNESFVLEIIVDTNIDLCTSESDLQPLVAAVQQLLAQPRVEDAAYECLITRLDQERVVERDVA